MKWKKLIKLAACTALKWTFKFHNIDSNFINFSSVYRLKTFNLFIMASIIKSVRIAVIIHRIRTLFWNLIFIFHYRVKKVFTLEMSFFSQDSFGWLYHNVLCRYEARLFSSRFLDDPLPRRRLMLQFFIRHISHFAENAKTMARACPDVAMPNGP